MKLLPLGSKRFEELTLEDLQLVGTVLDLNVEVTPELKQAAFELLAGNNIHSVSELIQSPESIQQLITFFQGGISALSTPSVIEGEGWAYNVEDLQV